MNTVKKLVALTILLFSGVDSSLGSEDWIVYKEADFSDRSDRARTILEGLRDRRPARSIPTAAIESWKRAGVDMDVKGYSIQPDRAFEGFRHPDQLLPISMIEANLGYQRMSFFGTLFEKRLEGVAVGVVDSKEVVHELMYVFNLPDLGMVYLNENSFSTQKEVRIARVAPLGNIQIGDTNGSLMVIRNKAGDKGRTFVDVVLDGRIMELYVLRTLDGDQLEKFKQLAYALN